MCMSLCHYVCHCVTVYVNVYHCVTVYVTVTSDFCSKLNYQIFYFRFQVEKSYNMEGIIVSVIQLSVPPALLVPSVAVSVTMVTMQ